MVPGRWVTTGSTFRRFIDVSPDGQRLVFGSGTMQEDLFVTDTDGSNMRQLTNDSALDRRPTWSPDGHQIAFESNRGGPVSDLGGERRWVGFATTHERPKLPIRLSCVVAGR